MNCPYCQQPCSNLKKHASTAKQGFATENGNCYQHKQRVDITHFKDKVSGKIKHIGIAYMCTLNDKKFKICERINSDDTKTWEVILIQTAIGSDASATASSMLSLEPVIALDYIPEHITPDNIEDKLAMLLPLL